MSRRRTLPPGVTLARRRALAEAQGMTEDAERYARMLAERRWCSRCGRSLRDPRSVELGVGPECQRRGAA